jgi:MFS family permease
MATLVAPAPPVDRNRPSRVWARDRRQVFYMAIGLVGLGAVIVGFSTTYIAPMARRDFHAPPIVHIHGLFALGWMLLFAAQSLLVRRGDTRLHMRLGIAGLPIAIGVVISGMMVGHWAAARDLPAQGAAAMSGLVGVFTSFALFVLFVAAALVMRRRPDWHKRLMLLATLIVWWPAWSRWRHLFPGISNPQLVFALLIPDVPMLVAGIRDKVRYGAVHPVWKFIAPPLFLEQLYEVLAFNTAAGFPPEIGRWLYQISG